MPGVFYSRSAPRGQPLPCMRGRQADITGRLIATSQHVLDSLVSSRSDRESIWELYATTFGARIRIDQDAALSWSASPDHSSDDAGRKVANYRSKGRPDRDERGSDAHPPHRRGRAEQAIHRLRQHSQGGTGQSLRSQGTAARQPASQDRKVTLGAFAAEWIDSTLAASDRKASQRRCTPR
jgi:hypothetical protein